MEFFLKHQKVILRTLGALLLIVGFVVNFWVTPQKAVNENAMALANVKRMEASVKGETSKKTTKKPTVTHIVKVLKATRVKQIKYMTTLAMAFGILFLGYSFFKKDEQEEEV